ncbi:hypothetical protein N1F89_05720 [Aquibium sp. A9E412]|uniref:hypothetical protein n=1 Tax=Aquibium sp. A9E412 TaxID=2976767 RepID=UPI0025AF626A|nr:hypothetical protein [Aquibium sp. A9E412]MDN2565713.1 hypothetical protein [Aquibium sp. A9E412]
MSETGENGGGGRDPAALGSLAVAVLALVLSGLSYCQVQGVETRELADGLAADVAVARQSISDCLDTAPGCGAETLRFHLLSYEEALLRAQTRAVPIDGYVRPDDPQAGFCGLVAAFNDRAEVAQPMESRLCED